MGNRIKPSINDLMTMNDDEIRECLSEHNRGTLMVLSREMVGVLRDYHRLVDELKDEKQLLYGRLNNIIALAQEEIK